MTTKYTYATPTRWPRTEERWTIGHARREHGPFLRLSVPRVLNDLEDELRKIRATNVAITTPAVVNRTGRPDASDLQLQSLKDPGIAIYLRRRTQDLVIALDRFLRPVDNIRGLTLALAGMRQVERYGGSGSLDRALSGFAALPAQAGVTVTHWSVALGLAETYGVWRASPDFPFPLAAGRQALLAAAERAYRELAKTHHPDRGGSQDAFVELGQAINDARKELTGG